MIVRDCFDQVFCEVIAVFGERVVIDSIPERAEPLDYLGDFSLGEVSEPDRQTFLER